MQRDAAKRRRAGEEGGTEGRKQRKKGREEERKDLFWREIKQKCGEMEARTKQLQSGDLLKTVIKVMEGPKTLTIRKKGCGGVLAALWGERGFKLLPSLPLFLFPIFTSLLVPWPDPSPAPSSSLSNQVTYIRSIFSLIPVNVEPSRGRFSTPCTHPSSGAGERAPAEPRSVQPSHGR